MRIHPLFILPGAVFLISSSLVLSTCSAQKQSGGSSETATVSTEGAATPKLVQEGYLSHYNFIEYGGRYYALPQSAGAFSLEKVQSKKYQDSYNADSIDGLKKQIMESMSGSNQNDRVPLLIAEGYKNHINVIRYQGKYYGLGQEEGAFVPEKVVTKQYKRIYQGSSPAEIDGQLH